MKKLFLYYSQFGIICTITSKRGDFREYITFFFIKSREHYFLYIQKEVHCYLFPQNQNSALSEAS